jgi:fatty acid desaturase
MTIKQRRSFRPNTLSIEKRKALRDAYRLEPIRNVRILTFVLIWALSGSVALQIDALAPRLVLYFLMGASIHGLGILMHEGVHHSMFRRQALNRWVALLCGVPALLSVTAYRVGHLPHHKFERGENDPDELENLSKNPRVLALLFCLTLFFGALFGFFRIGPANFRRATLREKREIVGEYAVIAGLVAVVFLTVHIDVLLHVWLIPLLAGSLLTNVRTLSEHALTDHDNPMSPTRTVLSNKLVSFFMCNLNYHVEHHLFPGVPYYHLPKLHLLLADEYRRYHVQVYRSYTQFLVDLGRFVLRAWFRRETRLAL